MYRLTFSAKGELWSLLFFTEYYQYTTGFGLQSERTWFSAASVCACVLLLLPAVGSCLLTDSSSSTNVTMFYLVHWGVLTALSFVGC